MGWFTKKKKPKEKKSDKDTKKAEKEREWSDIEEPYKFVCQGGKVQCPFCTTPIADIIVTSNTISLQDKPYATIADSNGKINFDFKGQCTAAPGITKPPCKSVIQLGKWKDYSDTFINGDNALLVRSTIPCNFGGIDINIVHSGQIEVLTEIEPRVIKNPRVTKIYWTYGDEFKPIKNKSRFYVDMNLHIETVDYEQGEAITIELSSSEGNLTIESSTISITGNVDENGSVIIKDVLKDYTLTNLI